ncbi:MAG: response regulator [Acidobacteriia bacterium]|nr:response regulator [Terriglobia bacterium]
MSETLTEVRTPTVYFIDDSATMREVIKIAFRKENIHVITCPDAASAIEQFGNTAPDAVITDLIMPDKDGYEVCQFIKQHEQFGQTPVILMSGVVNKNVAEKAMSVKADELIRKPFQPQDLINRVKNLLYPKSAEAVVEEASAPSASDLMPAPPHTAPAALNNLFYAGPVPAAPVHAAPRPGAPAAARPAARPSAPAPAPRPAAPPSAEAHKLRNEIVRLEMLVKRLQAELDAKSQYCTALEAHIKSQQESE